MAKYTIMCNVWTNDRSDYISGIYNGEVFDDKQAALDVMAKARIDHPDVDFYIEEAEI